MNVTEPTLTATISFFRQPDGTVVVHLSQGREGALPIGGSYRAGDTLERKKMLHEVAEILGGEQGRAAGWELP